MIAAQRSVDFNSHPFQPANLALVPTKIDHIGYVGLLPSLLETCSPPVTKKRRSLKKRVHFSENVDVAYFKRPTQDETQACWCQREDTERIRHNNKICLLAFHKVGCKATRLPSDKYCIRGLEAYLTKSTCAMSRYERKATIRSVLIAQQSETTKDSRIVTERLRMISLLRSRDKVNDAIRMAAKDSMIWREEYNQFL